MFTYLSGRGYRLRCQNHRRLCSGGIWWRWLTRCVSICLHWTLFLHVHVEIFPNVCAKIINFTCYRVKIAVKKFSTDSSKIQSIKNYTIFYILKKFQTRVLRPPEQSLAKPIRPYETSVKEKGLYLDYHVSERFIISMMLNGRNQKDLRISREKMWSTILLAEYDYLPSSPNEIDCCESVLNCVV